MDTRSEFEICDLLLRLFENDINDVELARLKTWFETDPGAAEFYLSFVEDYSTIVREGGRHLERLTESLTKSDSGIHGEIVNALAEINQCLERGSSSGETSSEELNGIDNDTILRDVVEQDLADSAIREAMGDDPVQAGSSVSIRKRKPITNRDRIRVLGRIAAMILACLAVIWLDRWIMRESASHPRPVLAYLDDQMEAKWDKSLWLPRANGEMTQDRYGLSEGIAQLRFENGSEVTIEAPAEWSLDAKDSLYVYRGRVFATVPRAGIGFSINTDSGKVVDLGTEFGVSVDERREMELHVLKGKTMLVSGVGDRDRQKAYLEQGQAVVVTTVGSVRPIDLRRDDFIRSIDSKTHMVWRGQTRVNLADLITEEGDGFGRANLTATITYDGGEPVGESDPIKRNSPFRLLPDLSCVDGVFVPNRGNGPVVISSSGLEFEDCPKTTGDYNDCIRNGQFGTGDGMIAGRAYGTAETPAILIHSNGGITFDLEAIRTQYPWMKIERFTTEVGVQTKPETDEGWQADFFVLVDGQVRFEKRSVRSDELHSVVVALDGDSRFLSLVITEGKPNGAERARPIHGDWGVFAFPSLHFQRP